jgi:sRNA-binding carbon storage regulator CsrA
MALEVDLQTTKKVRISEGATQGIEFPRSTQIIKEEIPHRLDQQFLRGFTKKRKEIIEVIHVSQKNSQGNNKKSQVFNHLDQQ